MKPNLGKKDRYIRLGIGCVLLVLAVSTKSSLLALGGIFSLFEAFFSWCVVYQIIGKNSCPKDHSTAVSFFCPFLIGWSILLTAIFLNSFATLIGWTTWYQFLTSQTSLPIDNYLFLFVIYPTILGGTGFIAYKLCKK